MASPSWLLASPPGEEARKVPHPPDSDESRENLRDSTVVGRGFAFGLPGWQKAQTHCEIPDSSPSKPRPPTTFAAAGSLAEAPGDSSRSGDESALCRGPGPRERPTRWGREGRRPGETASRTQPFDPRRAAPVTDGTGRPWRWRPTPGNAPGVSGQTARLRSSGEGDPSGCARRGRKDLI